MVKVKNLGAKIFYICSTFMILRGHLERTGVKELLKRETHIAENIF